MLPTRIFQLHIEWNRTTWNTEPCIKIYKMTEAAASGVQEETILTAQNAVATFFVWTASANVWAAT